MKKIFLSCLLIFVIALANVFAAGDLTTTTASLSLTGNPENTVSSSFTIQNTGLTDIAAINYQTSALTGTGGTIPANLVTGSITSLTTTEGPRTVPFSFTVPTSFATGDYTGTLRAEDIANPAANFISISFALHINPDTIEVVTFTDTNPLIITTKEDTTEIATFSISNPGTRASAITFTQSAGFDLSDADGDLITLSFSNPAPILPGATGSVTVTAVIPNGMESDTYGGIITVTKDTAAGPITDTFKLDIRVQPEEVICEEGEIGLLEIRDIDFDEDDFIPGGTMNIDVSVKNDDDESLDVIVEVFLYNVNEADFLDEAESESIDIDDGDTEDFEGIELAIPTNGFDESDEFILFVKAFEDGNEEDNCNQESDTLDLNLEDHDVIIEQFTLLPSTAMCGDEITATVDVLNRGKKDEDDVYVEITESTLGLSERSSNFDLDKFSDNNNAESVRFSIDIPEDLAEGDYPLEAIVYFDDGDETYSEITTLNVLSCGEQAPTLGEEEATISLLQSQFNVNSGDSLSIPVTITNTGNEAALFKVEARTSKGWDDSDMKTLELEADESRTIYLDLITPVKEGSYSVFVDVVTGTTKIATETVAVTVKGTETSQITGKAVAEKNIFSEIPDSFWIIANIVLVIVAIFFIKMIFTRKKQ